MGVRKLRPVTPSMRFRVAPDFKELTTDKPEKSLLEPLKKSGGRNDSGRRTMRYIGGGHKRMYRIIDFKRDKFDMPATVLSVEYDPNRSARISLVQYEDGEKRYIIAPQGITVGQIVRSGLDGVTPDVGNTLPLGKMPIGTIVHAIELQPGRGASMARSAGTYAQLVAREERYAVLRLPSSETRRVLNTCLATVGTVSNSDHMNVTMGKAGRVRWLGRRPRTRPVAMNPVDHPMGGGEGRASGGHPRSRNGQFAKGQKTRSRKNPSNKLIISRRKK
ncbi:ribosomal protein L2 [Fibrella aestuarina BUZ 2]|uniref:Large ribosomal subunit protein uL2 n=1 Tax=Fibrella aestuarina BUZ 2 TaxID=1166018 RepID=I0KGT2_9BACT|nr:50S ribosomal protein L2 [Fibrella aestuarina]CCH03335.1 ribosomal protein L2 [Fibrella aestuarina BUZ 2]